MENSDITNMAATLECPTKKVHRRNRVIVQKKRSKDFKASNIKLEEEATEDIEKNSVTTVVENADSEADCFRCLDFNLNPFDVWVDKFRNETDIITQGGGILPLLEQMHNSNQTTVSATFFLI